MCIELFLSREEVPKSVILPQQVHDAAIVDIRTGHEDLHSCDALVTKNREFSLGIKTADCAPVCFSDGTKIGIAHVGWRGLCLGLIEKMIEQFGSKTLVIYVAPFLDSFEIQKDFCYEQITEKFRESFIEHQSDRTLFHFKDVIVSKLPSQTLYDSRDIATSLSFPSHRRNKTDKRFFTIVSFAKNM